MAAKPTTPFWAEVIKAYEWVSANSYVQAVVERDGMRAEVHSGDTEHILIRVSHSVVNIDNAESQILDERAKIGYGGRDD